MQNQSKTPEAHSKRSAKKHPLPRQPGTAAAETDGLIGERSRAQRDAVSSATRVAMGALPARQPERLWLDRIATPIGTALLVTDEAGVLRALDFHDYEPRMLRLLRSHYGSRPLALGTAPAAMRSSLGRYFDGEFAALREIAWATAGTPFQRSVWNALGAIEPSHTLSYGELARVLGMPAASRAVGWANGSNPVAIVVPCHRVIGATGKLTGYGGGLHRKQWLLRHEGAQFAEDANRDLFRN